MLELQAEDVLLQLLHPLLLSLALLHAAPLHRLVLVLLSAQLTGRLIDLQLQRQLSIHQAQLGLLEGSSERQGVTGYNTTRQHTLVAACNKDER